MKQGSRGDLFIGWSKTMPQPDRRFMLGAAFGLCAGGVGVAAALALNQDAPGGGQWNQADIKDCTGELVLSPYPMLRLQSPGGVRTAFLGGSGKVGIRAKLPKGLSGGVTIRASIIQRGDNLMLAVAEDENWIVPAKAAVTLPPPIETDRGPALLTGEILDAKCWFGAMRPGFGKPHKSCAALCMQGGLPLAFCISSNCRRDARAPLFLDANGAPHGANILPFAADPVAVEGRLVQVDDLLQFRAAPSAIQRI